MALLFLGACQGVGGALLGSLGTAGIGYLGDATGQDIREAAVWRAKHQEIVSQVLSGILAQCRALEGPDITMSVVCYRKALEFSEAQQPKILFERLAKRARRAREWGGGSAPPVPN